MKRIIYLLVCASLFSCEMMEKRNKIDIYLKNSLQTQNLETEIGFGSKPGDNAVRIRLTNFDFANKNDIYLDSLAKSISNKVRTKFSEIGSTTLVLIKFVASDTINAKGKSIATYTY